MQLFPNSLHSTFLRTSMNTRADKACKSIFLSSYMHIGVVQGRTLMYLALYVCTPAYVRTNAQMVSAIALPSLPPAPKPTCPSVSTASITQAVIPQSFCYSPKVRRPRRITPAGASSKKYILWWHHKEPG